MANLSAAVSGALAAAAEGGGLLPEGFDADALDATLRDLREHLSLVTLSLASRPEKGSRGLRACTVLTVAGPVAVHRRYTPGGGRPQSPAFSGCRRRVTRGAVKALCKCGATLGSLGEAARTVGELLRFSVSPWRVRALTLDEGRRLCEAAPARSPAFGRPAAIPGGTAAVRQTMLVSADGTCVPCAKADTEGIPGRDGLPARSRELKVGMVGVYDRLGRDGAPVIPPNRRQYAVTHLGAREIGSKVLALARELGLGSVPRVQYIGDGAAWVAGIAGCAFRGAEVTVDFYHACSYLSTLCRELGVAGHEQAFRRARRIMKAYSADSALRHLRKKHPAQMKLLNEPAAAAYAYLADRARNMQYGRLRKQGFFIASGHIESACKFIVGSRCKQAGMHWRHHNAAYVSAIRAAIRSNTFWVT